MARKKQEIVENEFKPLWKIEKNTGEDIYMYDIAKKYLPEIVRDNIDAGISDYLFSLMELIVRCGSPIEQLLAIGFYTVELEMLDKFLNAEFCELSILDMEEIAEDNWAEFLYKDKNGKEHFYKPDFIFHICDSTEKKSLIYIIECDGFEYHSSKEQMLSDYKRERFFQKLGYKVIRFTGSEIYENPYRCANEFKEIVISDWRNLK